MISVLKEIMEPEIQESCIKSVVDVLRKVGHENTEIESVIIELYGLTVEKAAEYLQA